MATFNNTEQDNPAKYQGRDIFSKICDEFMHIGQMFGKTKPQDAPVTSFNNNFTPAVSAEPGIKNPA